MPPALSARARSWDVGSNSKTDRHDARSAAIVALSNRRLRVVGPADHAALLRLLAACHRDLNHLRTQAVCRVHALLCLLIAGGLPRRQSATAAAAALRKVRVTEPVDVERKAMANDLLADVHRLDNQNTAIKARITTAIEASATTVTDIHGVGPVAAAITLGHSGDIARFPTAPRPGGRRDEVVFGIPPDDLSLAVDGSLHQLEWSAGALSPDS